MKCSNVQYSIALCIRCGRSRIFLYNVQSSILFRFALLPSFFLHLLYPEIFINAHIRTNWEGLWICLLNDLLMDFSAICRGEKLGLGVFNFCHHAVISNRSLVPYLHSRSQFKVLIKVKWCVRLFAPWIIAAFSVALLERKQPQP